MTRSSNAVPPRARSSRSGLCVLAVAATFAAVAVQAEDGDSEIVSFQVEGAVTSAFVDGDDAAFKERHRIPTEVSGGISDVLLESTDASGGTLRLRGRAIFDANDYLADLSYRHDEGYLRAGYKEFRTWSDGSGGFFPQNGAFISLFDEEHQLDRGEAWIEAGVGEADEPLLQLSYRHLFRDGRKDSLAWGDSDLTGGFGTRNIVPSFWDIDEERDVFAIALRHALDSTKLGAGFRYEKADIDNARNMAREPGETGEERYVTQRDVVDTELFNAHAFSETRLLDDKVVLSTAYSYTDVEADLGGSRIYGGAFDAAFDPTFANRQRFDAGFRDLGGSTELRRHVGHLSVMGAPHEDLRAIAAVRFEREDAESATSQTATDVGAAPALAVSETPLSLATNSDVTKVTESLELRYSGLDDFIFYVRGEWEQTDRNLSEVETDTLASTVELERKSDADVFGQEYSVGGNWYPARRVNVSGKYYYELSDDDWSHPVDSTSNAAGSPNRYPAYLVSQDRETHGANARVTVRPLDRLRMTTRYDFRLSTIDVRADGLAEVEGAEVTSHAFGESITWTPVDAVFVQANLSYVLSETDTSADSLTGPAEGLVVDFDNDYWSASVLGGWAVDERTDLELRYVFYLAENYANNSTVSQPYGAEAQEHGVSLSAKRRLSDHVAVKGTYGFFTSDDDEFGGHDDYDVHLVGASVELDF